MLAFGLNESKFYSSRCFSNILDDRKILLFPLQVLFETE